MKFLRDERAVVDIGAYSRKTEEDKPQLDKLEVLGKATCFSHFLSFTFSVRPQ